MKRMRNEGGTGDGDRFIIPQKAAAEEFAEAELIRDL